MNLTVLLPVIDETASLRQTVDILLAENREHIKEIFIIVCGKTTPQAAAVCAELRAQQPDLIQVRMQERPFLGGAMRDGFDWATGSHVLMMASDLETDPATVKDLIAKAEEGYDIVTTTRWRGQGGFHGYSPLKYVLNWVFQQMFRLLYGVKLTDLTYGFRIFQARWVKTIAWEETRHAFLLESMLKPLRLGARAVEIPAVWRTRQEGSSHNPFWQNFIYFRTALKTRFTSAEHLLARS